MVEDKRINGGMEFEYGETMAKSLKLNGNAKQGIGMGSCGNKD